MNDELRQRIIDPQRWLREQSQRAERMREAGERARAELSEASVEVSSADRSVTVVVNPGGVLLDLSLSPHAEDMTTIQLADRIMSTYREACAEAAEHTIDIMSELTSEDSGAMDLLRSALPMAAFESDEDHDPDVPADDAGRDNRDSRDSGKGPGR